MAAVMSLPGTAGVIRSGETLGGRTAVTDEQGAFRTLRAMEAGPEAQAQAVKTNIANGLAMLEQANGRIMRNGNRNSAPFKTDEAVNALMDYNANKVSANEAWKIFNKVAKEALASGKLNAQEAATLKGAMGQTKVYVDAMALMGDNEITGVTKGARIYSGKPYNGTRDPNIEFTNSKGKSTLENHFDRHGGGYNSVDEYLVAARNFLEKPPTATTQSFVSLEGTYFRYDTATNEFGIINKYGGISTYYNTNLPGIVYWLDQISKYAPQ